MGQIAKRDTYFDTTHFVSQNGHVSPIVQRVLPYTEHGVIVFLVPEIFTGRSTVHPSWQFLML